MPDFDPALYPRFTAAMKATHTILIPSMAPLHFKLLQNVLLQEGYRAEVLQNCGSEVAQLGLKYVHNDTCYPALLVIGQFLAALQSGRYDLDHTALLITQTGGGCRASNYIHLLRKALVKAGYPQVPVASLNFSGLERDSGFKLSLPLIRKLLAAVFCGDLLMTLRNQVKPYEDEAGAAEALTQHWIDRLSEDFAHGQGIKARELKESFPRIVRDFAAIPVTRVPKVKVGIVGEIYVKYSPLGNNGLEQFLIDEGAEVTVPGLIDFFMYCIVSNLTDYELYGLHRFRYPILKFVFRYLIRQQQAVIDLIKEDGHFRPPTPITHTMELIRDFMGFGTKMGEGWLLPAEMLELNDSGVHNVVCTQPFGCLPNHICGKGMMKPLKEKNPDLNIVAIDYDSGASKVNQENRIKLMLANARSQLEEKNRENGVTPAAEKTKIAPETAQRG